MAAVTEGTYGGDGEAGAMAGAQGAEGGGAALEMMRQDSTPAVLDAETVAEKASKSASRQENEKRELP